ncbi:MAG: hypothetical protein QM771_02530 [Nitrospira sp.]
MLAVLMVVFLLTLLGMTSMQLAGQEIVGASALQEERVAHHAAEAAVDVVMGWFHDASLRPQEIGTTWFSKRLVNAQGDPSYVDAQGHGQFIGTSTAPDVVFDAANIQHDRLLNDPQTGWFKSLKGLAKILKLRVYGATRPGLLCTVEVTAGAGPASRVTKTLSMEFGAYAIPALHAPLQSGTLGSETVQSRAGSVLAHWGEMVVRGPAYLPRPEDVPVKSGMAAVSGQAYDEMSHREDRWLTIRLGGDAFFAQLPVEAWSGVPLNVHAHQEPVPGIKVDQWEYATLKRMAMQFGQLYGIDREGLLYAGGVIQPGMGRPASEVFAAKGPGDHRGLVFVDTLDGMPPGLDNLGSIVLDQDYAEGIFIVNAHVLWKAAAGKAVPALSPRRMVSSRLGHGSLCSSRAFIFKGFCMPQVMCDLPGTSKSTAGWRHKGRLWKLAMGVECWRFGITTISAKGLCRGCLSCLPLQAAGRIKFERMDSPLEIRYSPRRQSSCKG